MRVRIQSLRAVLQYGQVNRMFRLMVQPVRRRTLYVTGTESNDGSVATDD